MTTEERIALLETKVAMLEAMINENKADIASNKSGIVENKEHIKKNAGILAKLTEVASAEHKADADSYIEAAEAGKVNEEAAEAREAEKPEGPSLLERMTVTSYEDAKDYVSAFAEPAEEAAADEAAAEEAAAEEAAAEAPAKKEGPGLLERMTAHAASVNQATTEGWLEQAEGKKND